MTQDLKTGITSPALGLYDPVLEPYGKKDALKMTKLTNPVIFVTVQDCEVEETMQIKNVVGSQGNIICLSNGGYCYIAERNTKL